MAPPSKVNEIEPEFLVAVIEVELVLENRELITQLAFWPKVISVEVVQRVPLRSKVKFIILA
jgi:hypothetical protein